MRERLLARYRGLLSEFASTDEELRLVQTIHPGQPEIEERGQEEALAGVLARLEDRQQEELREIQDALGRIDSGEYGRCERCGREISAARLEALPRARHCLDCGRALEAEERGESPARGPSRERVEGTPPPPELAGASDAEIEEAALEELQEAGGEALRDVRASSEDGRVRLSGEVPSEEDRALALEAVTDRLGLAVLDELRIARFPYEREDEVREREPARDQPEMRRAKEIREKDRETEYSPPDHPVRPPRKP